MKTPLFLLSALLLTLVSCDPVPRGQLTSEMKQADMMWIFSIFENNYAPLSMKEKLHGINFKALKDQYMQEALATGSNEEFYLVMQKFVAEFKDGHTGASLTTSELPGRTHVAYLGFSGTRIGNNFLVQSIFPTNSGEMSSFPLEVGDRILAMDGQTLPEIIAKDFLPYENVGHDEANLTIQMNNLFTRISLNHKMPTTENSELKILRINSDGDAETLVIELPWIIKDLVDLKKEMAEARKEKEATKTEKDMNYVDRFQIRTSDDTIMNLNFADFNGFPFSYSTLLAKLDRKKSNYSPLNSFVYVPKAAKWISSEESEQGETKSSEIKTTRETLSKVRNVPADAIMIDVAKTYPAYVNAETLPDGTEKLIGYILVHSFSVENDEAAYNEFLATLKQMRTLGVKDLVLDLINNGGGSLSLGMMMAQALSNEKVEMPDMQFGLNDHWLDDLERNTLHGSSDTEKELSRRIFNKLLAEKKSGARLSSKIPSSALMPYALRPNKSLKKRFNTVVMVNEMCASMCDIFAGIMQDNKLATIIGTRSMGAGGNVVQHFHAPNSHLLLRQTESLFLRKDGSYLENGGVTPDVALSVNEDTESLYTNIRNAAIEILKK